MHWIFSWQGRVKTVVLTAIFVIFAPWRAGAIDPAAFAVEVSAVVQTSPPRITLQWPGDPFALSYRVYRKAITATSWGNPVAELPGSATSYTDASVLNFSAYEYQIEEPFSGGGTAYGYIYAGLATPAAGLRGKIVLVVESAVAGQLVGELAQLQQDLTGDGWYVLRHDVSREDSPRYVKSIIKGEYDADPANVKSVFLFGHVPVPYSGDLNPDMHPGHKGAWPADAYYGDMDGNWTDNSVYEDHSEDPRNYNTPGDGKFDQSDLPSPVELEVGRVDLSDLPAFAPKTEVDLLRQYLVKDHRFRHKQFEVERRALVRDNFGEIDGDAPATDAWRNFPTFFGVSNIRVAGPGQFFPILNNAGYLWAYGCGGGAEDKADGVGSTADFARNDPKAVFLILHGSYFGDWDFENNFLRAALATPSYCLASSWAGLPHWFLHHMALGETIGFSTRLNQNNAGLYRNMENLSAGQVHISLMGDPTLRMHAVTPPGALSATAGNGVVLNWGASPEATEGYTVYRAESPMGPFSRLNRSLVTGTSFADATAPAGSLTYMVRAIKLESTASGTYQNPSQGVFTTLTVGGGSLSTVTLVVADGSADENGDPGTFIISRGGPVSAALTVNFALSGSAIPGVDFEAIGNQVILAAGQSSVTLTVRPMHDNIVEGDESVSLDLTSGNYSIGAQNRATVVIHDVAPAPPPATILSIQPSANGSATLRFNGAAGRSYRVEAAADLLNWSVLHVGTANSNSLIEYIDSGAAGAGVRFYRVVWQ